MFSFRRSVLMAVQKIDPRQPDSTDLEVGHLVRLQRMERGLSQTELAKHIGVTFQQLQKYESGANRISMGRLTRIAKALRVDVMYLLGGGRQAAPASNPRSRRNPRRPFGCSDALGRCVYSGLSSPFHQSR